MVMDAHTRHSGWITARLRAIREACKVARIRAQCRVGEIMSTD
jgi:hypothetical protein